MREILKSEEISITGGSTTDFITIAVAGITTTTLLIWGNFYLFPATQYNSHPDSEELELMFYTIFMNNSVSR